MPKIVDHDARRREISQALWRVLNRDGMRGVTVRSVAAEAGMSKATLGYYFTSQAELLIFALSESKDASAQRITKAERKTREDFVDALCETVPTTPKRRRQAEIWMAVVAEAQSDDKLRATLADLDAEVRVNLLDIVNEMRERKLIHKSRDLEVEATLLHALLDGLTVHTVNDPRRLSGADVKATVAEHVARLAR